MYIRLIDSTLRENEYLFRLNDQQKVYLQLFFSALGGVLVPPLVTQTFLKSVKC